MIDFDSEPMKSIMAFVKEAGEPVETKEIQNFLQLQQHGGPWTRDVIFNRLMLLAQAGRVRGKTVGAARGTYIWWV